MHGHSGGRSFGSRRRNSSWSGSRGWGWWGTSGYADDSQDAQPVSPQLTSSIQSCLAQVIGTWVPQTGRFGRATRHALRRFQVRQNLPASGYPDSRTIAQLQRACSDQRDSNASRPDDSPESVAGEFSSSQSIGLGNLGLSAVFEVAVLRSAIQKGERDINKLTDLVFNRRHPERGGQKLRQDEQSLVNEWLDIQAHLVIPQLQTSAGGAQSASSAPPSVAQQLIPTRPGTKPRSTTSGIEADGDTTRLIPCILKLQDQGRKISFVQRYLRDLTRKEVAALKAAGFVVVSCYEVGNKRYGPTLINYFTREQGLKDARRGFAQAHAVGMPADRPVYFTVDMDPEPRDKQLILNYVQGLSEGYALYLADMLAQNKQQVTYAIGMYGSGMVLDWCKAQGLVSWFWQAFAPGWYNNLKTWSHANIRTAGLDTPERCNRRFGHLEGWGNEGGW